MIEPPAVVVHYSLPRSERAMLKRGRPEPLANAAGRRERREARARVKRYEQLAESRKGSCIRASALDAEGQELLGRACAAADRVYAGDPFARVFFCVDDFGRDMYVDARDYIVWVLARALLVACPATEPPGQAAESCENTGECLGCRIHVKDRSEILAAISARVAELESAPPSVDPDSSDEGLTAYAE